MPHQPGQLLQSSQTFYPDQAAANLLRWVDEVGYPVISTRSVHPHPHPRLTEYYPVSLTVASRETCRVPSSLYPTGTHRMTAESQVCLGCNGFTLSPIHVRIIGQFISGRPRWSCRQRRSAGSETDVELTTTIETRDYTDPNWYRDSGR